MFATITSESARRVCPGSTLYRAAVAAEQISTLATTNALRKPPRSASAPSTGEPSATTMAVIVTARDHNAVPRAVSATIACKKYVAYTNVTTSVVNDEFAKSNSAHDQ